MSIDHRQGFRDPAEHKQGSSRSTEFHGDNGVSNSMTADRNNGERGWSRAKEHLYPVKHKLRNGNIMII
jgi:hypothetical protein